MNEISSKKLLKNVQIIVRYCFLEEPYWNAFISHYFDLGVKKIHVIVQLADDIHAVENFSYPKDLDVLVYKTEEKNPNAGLINFRIDRIRQNEKYTLIIDPDEFLYCFNNNLNLSKLIDSKDRLYIRWLMNPITTNLSLSSGFLGEAGKEIGCSAKIKGIHNCHKFEPHKPQAIKPSRFGLFLIHNWSRSLIDCLLKSSFSNFGKPRANTNSFKNSLNEKKGDHDQIQENLTKGILFQRAKYLAFLDIQTRYITGIKDNYTHHFDQEKELELIMKKYSEYELKLFFELFEEYKFKLSKSINLIETYPPFDGGIIDQMPRFRTDG